MSEPRAKAFRVKIALRNNRLIEARESLGMTQAQFAKALGVSRDKICSYESLRRSPVGTWNAGRVEKERRDWVEWKNSALRIAAGLGVLPEELWPEEVLLVRENEAILKLDAPQVSRLMASSVRALSPRHVESTEDIALKIEGEQRALALLRQLPPQQSAVLIERFGLNGGEGDDLKEIGDRRGLSRARIRQIESEALNTLRSRMERSA